MSDNATSPAQNDNQKLGDQKLKLAGYSYIAGDLGLVSSELIKERLQNKALPAEKQKSAAESLKGAGGGALIWMAGGLAAARYGNPNAEKQLEILAQKLKTHLKQEGFDISAGLGEQNELLQQQGLFNRIENFLYQHPSEMLNAAYAIGASMMVHSGAKDIAAKKTSLLGRGAPLATNFWTGSLVLGGALGGLLIKEDPQAREKAKNAGMFGKVKAYFSEKALRFPGLMYGLNNIVLAGRVWNEHKEFSQSNVAFKPHYFSAVTLATYVFSNLMLQFSSRDQITQNLSPEAIAKLEDASARIIAAQPAQVQQALLADMSRYLAEQKGVGQDAPQIAQALATRLTEITGQRAQQAAETVSWTAREQARMQAAPAHTTL